MMLPVTGWQLRLPLLSVWPMMRKNLDLKQYGKDERNSKQSVDCPPPDGPTAFWFGANGGTPTLRGNPHLKLKVIHIGDQWQGSTIASFEKMLEGARPEKVGVFSLALSHSLYRPD